MAPRTATGRPAGRKAWTELVAQRQPQFALEAPESPPAPELDLRAVVGQPKATSTRRVLLDAVALAIPPSINAYWGQRVIIKEDGKPLALRYVTHEGKAYQDMLRAKMLDMKAWYRSEQPIELRMLLCFKDDRLQDCDNRVKSLQDALAYAQVIVNDKQVKILEVREGPHLKPAVCYVTVKEILPDRAGNLNWIKARGDDNAPE